MYKEFTKKILAVVFLSVLTLSFSVAHADFTYADLLFKPALTEIKALVQDYKKNINTLIAITNPSAQIASVVTTITSPQVTPLQKVTPPTPKVKGASVSPVTIKQNNTTISEAQLLTVLTKLLNKPEIISQLKGQKGDPGLAAPELPAKAGPTTYVQAPSPYNFGSTIPPAPQSGPIGFLGGFTALGAQDLTTTTLHATGTSTLANLVVTGGSILNGNLTVSGSVSVPDQVYGVAWNGNTEAPTKNAVYDKLEAMIAGDSDGVYSGSGTIPTNAVATVTDRFNFHWEDTTKIIGDVDTGLNIADDNDASNRIFGTKISTGSTSGYLESGYVGFYDDNYSGLTYRKHIDSDDYALYLEEYFGNGFIQWSAADKSPSTRQNSIMLNTQDISLISRQSVSNYGTFTLNGSGLEYKGVGSNFNKGILYFADYSADYTARSLVDKGYVTSALAAGTTLAAISVVSTDSTKSLYTMTSTIPVEFRRSGGSPLLYLDETNGRVGIGTTSPSSKLDITTNSLGTTQTIASGIALVNTTPAAAGAPQISPAIRWRGYGWKTDATAESRPVDFRTHVIPSQGTSNPPASLRFSSSINNGSYDTVFGIGSSGEIFAGSGNPGSSNQILRSGGLGGSASWANFADLLNSNFSSGSGTNFTGSRVDLGGDALADITINANSHVFKITNSDTVKPAGLVVDSESVYMGDLDNSLNSTILKIQDDLSTAYIDSNAHTAKFGINMIDPSVALDVTGDIEYTGSLTQVSDERLKENINPIVSSIEQLRQINPVSYNLIGDSRLKYGFTAQNIQSVFPSAVSIINKNTGYLGLDYTQLISPAISAIQELDLKVTDLYSIDATKETSLASIIKKFLADVGNGVENIFAKKVHTEELCVKKSDGNEICITGDQLDVLLLNGGQSQQVSNTPSNNTEENIPIVEPEVVIESELESGGDTESAPIPGSDVIILPEIGDNPSALN